MKKTISVILAVFLVFSLSACGKSKYAGTYKFYSAGNEDLEYIKDDSVLAGLIDSAYEFVLEKDGTGSVSIMGFKVNLTWNKKSITIAGEKIKIAFKDDTLIMYDDNSSGTVVFKKQ